jgi:hypothetical protein
MKWLRNRESRLASTMIKPTGPGISGSCIGNGMRTNAYQKHGRHVQISQGRAKSEETLPMHVWRSRRDDLGRAGEKLAFGDMGGVRLECEEEDFRGTKCSSIQYSTTVKMVPFVSQLWTVHRKCLHSVD